MNQYFDAASFVGGGDRQTNRWAISVSGDIKPYETVGEYIRDVAIAFVLVVTGIICSGFVFFPLNAFLPYSIAYTIALFLCLIPFFWFAKRARVLLYDGWDYVALFAFVVMFATLVHFQSALEAIPGLRHAIPAVVVVACIGFLDRRRRSRKPRDPVP